MSVRFRSIFPTERGVEVTLEIWDTDYAGAVTAFNTGPNGYNLAYSANGFEQAAQFMATQCDFTFWIEDATHEAMITDFLEAPEGRFLIRIYEETALHWTGIVLFDSTSYEERDYPFALKIKAVDGVGALKDVPYDDAGTPYTGKDKIITYLCRALSKISYVPEFYTTGDVFLRTAVDWWEETMDNVISGVDMLDQAYITNAVYYDYDKGILIPKSCYDVIKDILTTLGARITYANGAFWIEQLSYRRSETIVIRLWETDGTFINADTYNSPNTIDQTASGALLAIANYESTAPISSATHTFFAKERRNFLAGAENVNELNTGIDSNIMKYNRGTQSTYIDTAALEGKTDEELENLKNLNLVSPDQIASIAEKKLKAEAEKNKYVFEMPTEYQTIEDLANAELSKGTPTLDPALVTSWQNKLEEVYSPTRDKLKRNMADYWASQFSQGGGSGKQVAANIGELNAIELDKTNRAYGLAESDLATKLSAFQNAQNILSGIGGVKVQAGQFGSAQDAATAFQNAQLAWQQQKAAMDQQNALTMWNKQSDLAKYLAEMQRPKSMDFLSQLGTGLVGNSGNIIASLISGGAFGGAPKVPVA